MSSIMPLARKKKIVLEEINGECLVYDLNSNKAFCLNSMSNRIWKQCDGKKKVKDVAESLSRQTNVKIDEDFIWLAIIDLQKNNLLEEETISPAEFANFSRQAVMRKYSLPSWIHKEVFR